MIHYNDSYYDELINLIEDLYPNETDITELDDDFSILVEDCSLRKIFVADEKLARRIGSDVSEWKDDLLPEEADDTIDQIIKAVVASIDLDKMNALLPELWYPNGDKYEVTKQEMLEEIK